VRYFFTVGGESAGVKVFELKNSETVNKISRF